MGTTVEKLNKVIQTKEALRTAINSKGGTLTESDTFSSYATAIDNIQTGSEENPLQEVINNQSGDGKPNCRYLFSYYDGTSLDSVLSTLDTSNVTDMNGMFYGCSNLTSIPQLDTSKVTNMRCMFQACRNLTTIPQLDTSNVTDMSKMFSGLYAYDATSTSFYMKLTSIPLFDTSKVTRMDDMFYQCYELTNIPQLDTSNVTDMYHMFYKCENLTTIPLLNTSNVTNMYGMFEGCRNLTSIPQLDTSKVTNMSSMFESCSNLTSIPQLDTSKVTNMGYMFDGCNNLKEIHMTGMKISFDISASTNFTESALVEILNNLATVTSTKKLTMGSTNLAKLTDEEKAIATNKGWTLA